MSRATRSTSVRSGEPPLWLTPMTSASVKSGRAPYSVIALGEALATGQAEPDLGEVRAVQGGVVGRAAPDEDDVARAPRGDLGRHRGDRRGVLAVQQTGVPGRLLGDVGGHPLASLRHVPLPSGLRVSVRSLARKSSVEQRFEQLRRNGD